MRVYSHPVAVAGHSGTEYHHVTLPAPPWRECAGPRRPDALPGSTRSVQDRVLDVIAAQRRAWSAIEVAAEAGLMHRETERCLRALVRAGRLRRLMRPHGGAPVRWELAV